MEITLKRNYQYGEAIEGTLYVENAPYCHTLENIHTALPKGKYPIVWYKCKHVNHWVPLVVTNDYTTFMNAKCRYCKLVYEANNNTPYPRLCPQIKVGNGIVKRRDGRILVGKLATKGCLVNSQAYYNKLQKFFRAATNKGKQLILVVK